MIRIHSCLPSRNHMKAGWLKLVRFPSHSPLPTRLCLLCRFAQKLHSLDRDVFYVADPISSIRAERFLRFFGGHARSRPQTRSSWISIQIKSDAADPS
jgi:hypothetical protein